MQTIKCAQCRLVNYADTVVCPRCESVLARPGSRLIRRTVICLSVCFAMVLGFYLSLVASAKSLTFEQKTIVLAAVQTLREKGFTEEASMLETFTVFRRTDNWLNAAVEKENAFAATNFPFEIVTVYSDFFTFPADDVERAAILLHETRHLRGEGEKEAYEFVWKNRKKLGWTRDKYSGSQVWESVRSQTRDFVPGLFVCEIDQFSDCTEDPTDINRLKTTIRR